MSADELAGEVEGFAKELGFDEVGFAPAGRAPGADIFHGWLAMGFHGEMGWLERDAERRCDPRRQVECARSVIVLATNYWTGDGVEDGGVGGKLRGRVARYAWGRDYHIWIRKRLRKLSRFLEERGGRQRVYVDAGPLLERDFAVLAGVAWRGKNSLALHPRLGTWFFLSAIVTTLELPAGEPMRERCGSCTRCMVACPTGAILAPGVVDARLCLAYWTIEWRGDIPEWIRPLMGDRIFGCDDCLEVCPWNRFARASADGNLRVREGVRMGLVDYLRLDEEGFGRVFEGSPVRRAGRDGFLRNVCVVLGNVGGVGELGALEEAARDASPLVARHARWAIGRIMARVKG